MLVSLEAMKTYLGETGTDYDTFLTQQILTVSEAIEGYCGRRFNSAAYTQTFYKDEMVGEYLGKLVLFHYPVTVLTSVTNITDTIVLDSSEYRCQLDRGFLKHLSDGRKISWFNDSAEALEVVYTAGYTTIPAVILSVVYSLVEAAYNKKKSGVSVDFGSDVQSISIPGTLTINFDYTLQANDRKSAYGMIIGNYGNVLDGFRSERTLLGNIEDYYVS